MLCASICNEIKYNFRLNPSTENTPASLKQIVPKLCFTMSKLLSILFLSFIVATCLQAQSITQDQAKKLTASLTSSNQDTSQLNTLLKLARYHINKPGENKIDLDSGASFIDRAEALNQKLHSKTGEGSIYLTRSFYLRESGEKDKAK